MTLLEHVQQIGKQVYNNIFDVGNGIAIPKGAPDKEFIIKCIDSYKASNTYQNAIEAEAYYRNKNTEIRKHKRHYIDKDGNAQEARYLPNTKLSHGLFRVLVDQKANYLLANDFRLTFEADKTEDMQKLFNAYFTRNFRKTIYNLCKYGIMKGTEWAQVYYDAEGTLKVKRIPRQECIPFWEDADHTELKAFIRFYDSTGAVDIIGTSKITVEYYTTEGVTTYELQGNNLKFISQNSHFSVESTDPVSNEKITSSVSWEKIPFIPFKYNCVEESLLSYVKPLIDDYDLIMSTVSNLIKEIPDSILVLKGYDGKADKEEIKRLIMLHRLVTLKETGSIENLNTSIETDPIEAQLSRIRKDVYESGQGVDVQDQNVGNPSGTALKYRFAGLDSDCKGMEIEVKAAFEQLLFFISADLAIKGNAITLDKIKEAKPDIMFNKEFIVNTSEKVIDCQQSYGIISRETIVKNHPFVKNAHEEMKLIEAEQALSAGESTGYGTNTATKLGTPTV